MRSAFRGTPVALPEISPMLAVAGSLPREPSRYGFELKWDGVRALAYWDGRELRLRTRSGADTTFRYPELAPLAAALGPRPAILDGEIIAADAEGRPSFGALQRRMHVGRASGLQRLVRTAPVYYMLFDLLHLGRTSLLGVPYTERRERLEALRLDAAHWRTPPARLGAAEEILRLAQHESVEGIVAKRLESTYESGVRSDAWVKIKPRARQEFVVGGWQPGTGEAAGGVGSLLLGYHDREGSLRFAGKVGTGFTHEDRRLLLRELERTEVRASPFADPVPHRGVRYARPRLVAEVAFAEWTSNGQLRQPAFLGLRPDKRAEEVVREPQGAPR